MYAVQRPAAAAANSFGPPRPCGPITHARPALLRFWAGYGRCVPWTSVAQAERLTSCGEQVVRQFGA